MSGQQQGGGDDKNSMQILWLIFAIFLIGAGVWWGFSKELKQSFIFIKLSELRILDSVFSFLHLDKWQQDVAPSLSLARKLHYANLNPDTALRITATSGKYFRFPIAFLTFLGCYYFYVKNVKVRYKKRYSMITLMRQEKHQWPQVKVVSQLNLAGEDINKGPWAMAYTPMQFCRKHNLLKIIVDTTSGYGRNVKYIAELKHDKAEQVFSQQLGKAWHGPERMSPHRRALFAVFIARANRDTKIAQGIIKRLNHTIGEGREADYTDVDKMLSKHYNSKAISKICNSHAYETTVMASILLLAREDGVLASADFLWLKPLDRKIWYTLNSIGRQTPYVEVAGVHSHWLAEKALGKPLTVPYISEAVKGLDVTLKDIIYTPTEAEEEKITKALEGKK